ncbi:MAG TPA: DUF1579 domain-containing protein [Terricaulis sp.]|nr:DUF1579 domain-containing protein [Terricaulis sp.]
MSSEQDFDFLVGDWNVAHSRLNGRLVGSNDWQDFAGACSMRKLMGGFGNVDENILHLPDGAYQAVALRSFNSETRQWAIWWLDGRSPHTLDAPVIGAFADGVGEFFADDTLNSQPIRVRFRWSETHTANPRWEQAFSADGGETWEVNWRMRFSRA